MPKDKSTDVYYHSFCSTSTEFCVAQLDEMQTPKLI